MTDAIIMLTLNDKTLTNAREMFHQMKDSKVKYFGFKDIGIPYPEMKILAHDIKENGKELFFEIVSATKEDTLRGAQRAIELGVDYLIGGKYVEEVLSVVKDKAMKYYPYVGEIIGHPCKLGGTQQEMIDEIDAYKKLGVDGVNVLAYRYIHNADLLIEELAEKSSLPLLMAGSVDSKERIDFLKNKNIDLFTMGTALFENQLVDSDSLQNQLDALDKFTFGE